MKPTQTLFLLPLLLLLAACNSGLNPRVFEKLRYDMPRAEAAAILAEKPWSRLILMPLPGASTETWVIDEYQGLHPHPFYSIAYRDERLQSVVISRLVAQAVPNEHYDERGFSTRRLDQLRDFLRENRHPLAWQELEGLDTEHHQRGPDPTTYTVAMVLIFPPATAGALLSPILIPLSSMMEGDNKALAMAKRARSLELTAGTTQAAAEQALGPPTSRHPHRNDPRCEHWDYVIKDRMVTELGCRLGFIDGKLAWIYLPRPEGR